MNKPNEDLRGAIYKVFEELGTPSANTGMEKPYVVDCADQILTLFTKHIEEAELGGRLDELARAEPWIESQTYIEARQFELRSRQATPTKVTNKKG